MAMLTENLCCNEVYYKGKYCLNIKNISALSLLSDPEYIDIEYICLHVNYLNKILFKPTDCILRY